MLVSYCYRINRFTLLKKESQLLKSMLVSEFWPFFLSLVYRFPSFIHRKVSIRFSSLLSIRRYVVIYNVILPHNETLKYSFFNRIYHFFAVQIQNIFIGCKNQFNICFSSWYKSNAVFPCDSHFRFSYMEIYPCTYSLPRILRWRESNFGNKKYVNIQNPCLHVKVLVIFPRDLFI